MLDLFRTEKAAGQSETTNAATTVLGNLLHGSRAVTDVSASYAAHASGDEPPEIHVVL